eukprot:1147661-Pelagomonas_calceolata.AAC.3
MVLLTSLVAQRVVMLVLGMDGDPHEDDGSPLQGLSDFQDIQVPDDSTLAQFVAELEHEHGEPAHGWRV